MCIDIKTIADVGSHIATLLAVAAAGWWFLYTTQFKPRLQFDSDCHFIALHNSDQLLAEIQFVFENKGFVEHRFWNLNVSLHALKSEQNLTAKKSTHEVQFDERLLHAVQLVPKQYEYYFVRPGVRQVLTHTIAIPTSVSAIRITASFDYGKDKQFPHTARRVFQVRANASEKSSLAWTPRCD